MDLSVLVVILVFSIHSVVLAEIIPLERAAGCPILVVDVENAENNPQRVKLDTGSTHSYLPNHPVMANLPRAQEHARIAGFRENGFLLLAPHQFKNLLLLFFPIHNWLIGIRTNPVLLV